MLVRQLFRALCCAAAIFYLAGCGGGGDGGTVTSTDTFALQASVMNDFNNTRSLSFNVSGAVNGTAVSGSGSITYSAISSSTFEGVAAYKKTEYVSMTLSANGVTVPVTNSYDLYVDTSYAPLGQNDPSGEYLVVDPTTLLLPSTGKVNDSGTAWVVNRYDSSAKTSYLGTDTLSYALEPDTAHTALLRLTHVERDTTGSITSTTVDLYRITPDGSLTWLSESGDGLTLTITN